MPPRDQFRAFARRTVELPITVRAEGEPWTREATMVDLSLGGACLELNEYFETGTVIALEIKTPTLWDPLLLRGHVVWGSWNAFQTGARHGICFDHDNPTALMALFELIGAQGFEP